MNQTAQLPYSAIRQTGDTIYIAGQVGWDLDTKIASESLQEQAHQVMKNIETQLKSCGSSLSDLVKVNVYLTDMADFNEFNEVYKNYVTDPYPVRTCIGVSELPRVANVDLVVEADAIAVKK